MRDVCFNRELMYFVGQGGAPAVWTDETAARVARAASMYRWDGERLWLLSKHYPSFKCNIPPIWCRRILIAEVQSTLGYPGGKRVAALVRQWYYWTGLLADCIEVCSRAELYQKERARFNPNPPYLCPTSKGGRPFLIWCVDLITGMDDPAGPGGETIIIMCVCGISQHRHWAGIVG